ncbi:MAG: DUF2619 domain-containing protein [Tepidanaerobacteraceae bacterium]
MLPLLRLHQTLRMIMVAIISELSSSLASRQLRKPVLMGRDSMDPILTSMAIMRFISSVIELAAAFLILNSRGVERALRINAALGLVGPLIFTAVSLLGLVGISGKLSFAKLLIILIGVILVLIGTSAS